MTTDRVPGSHAIILVPEGIVEGAVLGVCAGFVGFILYRTFNRSDDGSTLS
jgi:hypothetical protein